MGNGGARAEGIHSGIGIHIGLFVFEGMLQSYIESAFARQPAETHGSVMLHVGGKERVQGFVGHRIFTKVITGANRQPVVDPIVETQGVDPDLAN